jgi:hypothetical protein
MCVISYINFLKSEKDKDAPDTTKLIYALNMILFIPLYVTWHILDLFLFGFNVYEDGNKISLNNWK